MASSSAAVIVAILSGLATLPLRAATAPPASVQLNWLDRTALQAPAGVSWGVPWPRGAVSPQTSFDLTAPDGKSIPIQTWPLAYWPDGSLKWTGNAASFPGDTAGPLTLTIGPAAPVAAPLAILEDEKSIAISSGTMTWRIPKTGRYLVDSISMAGRVVATQGELVCMLEDRSEFQTKRILREEDFSSQISSVKLEQAGPLRAVVKIDGMHRSQDSDRAFLPFTIRLYFYAGQDSVRMVHTFIFDGDQDKDFIRGLGVRFSVPMRQQLHNRHVRLAGETGLFAEPIRLIPDWKPAFSKLAPNLYPRQLQGEPMPNEEDMVPQARAYLETLPVWDGYKLVQISADSFAIQKRTGAASAWINAAAGTRALGTAFIGDTTGGVAVGMKNFWQLSPTELEIENASTDAAELTAWLWSPDSPAMDLRHYDTKGHGLAMTYEDVQPGFSTATGIARTTELTFQPFSAVPSDADLVKFARSVAQPPLLVCTPQYYHSLPVFGIWSLPDRSTPGKNWIEDQLDTAISFYQSQIAERHWYGFWDFGDVMHTYDTDRHSWRYDIGGYAWSNTELMPNLWLWDSFLRSGRADIYRMAEAMTRQTQEVDVYHIGRFAPLGSRHNVRHWGDGAKEPRISQAILKRCYYFLTTDERTGDLMHEVVDADFTMVGELDPLRHIEPPSKYPTHVRVGPDWLAFCGNWFTEWERTGNTKYRDKIIVGMTDFAAMPHGLFSGESYGYVPATGHAYQIHDDVFTIHLAPLFGGPELCFEMNDLIDQPKWNDAWMQYCEYLTAPPEVQTKVLGAAMTTSRGCWYSRLTAYAAMKKNDPALAARAWHELLHESAKTDPHTDLIVQQIDGPEVPNPIDEIPHLSTNDNSQWCLNAIELLQMIGNDLPAHDPYWEKPGKSHE